MKPEIAARNAAMRARFAHDTALTMEQLAKEFGLDESTARKIIGRLPKDRITPRGQRNKYWARL